MLIFWLKIHKSVLMQNWCCVWWAVFNSPATFTETRLLRGTEMYISRSQDTGWNWGIQEQIAIPVYVCLFLNFSSGLGCLQSQVRRLWPRVSSVDSCQAVWKIANNEQSSHQTNYNIVSAQGKTTPEFFSVTSCDARSDMTGTQNIAQWLITFFWLNNGWHLLLLQFRVTIKQINSARHKIFEMTSWRVTCLRSFICRGTMKRMIDLSLVNQPLAHIHLCSPMRKKRPTSVYEKVICSFLYPSGGMKPTPFILSIRTFWCVWCFFPLWDDF